MTSTTITTWSQIFTETFDQINCDPQHDLDLTDAQRDELNAASHAYFESAVDKVLAPYGAFITGNGEIILKDVKDETVDEWPDDIRDSDLREELGMISFESFEHPLY